MVEIEVTAIPNEIARKHNCSKGGTIYTDGHGHSGWHPYYCGSLTCKTCLPHRINREKSSKEWMNNGDYVFKNISSVDMKSPEKIDDAFKLLHTVKDNVLYNNTNLWFEVGLTSKHVMIVLKKEDTYVLPEAKETTFDEFIREFVDFTEISGTPAEETLLIKHKNQRRILSHGKKPHVHKPRCVKAVKDKENNILYGLRKKPYIASEEEIKEHTEYLPIKETPVELVTYCVHTQEQPDIAIKLSFKQFVDHYLLGEFEDEWEKYFGDFYAKKMQDHLNWLSKHNKNFAHLKDFSGV